MKANTPHSHVYMPQVYLISCIYCGDRQQRSHTPPHFIRVPFDFVFKFSVKLLTMISELKRKEKKNKNMWYKNVILYERVQFKAYFENTWLSLKMQSEHKLFYRCFISLVVGRRYCRTGSKYFHTNSIKDAQLHFRNFKTAGASESVVIPLCSWCWLMSAFLILFVCLSFFFFSFRGAHVCMCTEYVTIKFPPCKHNIKWTYLTEQDTFWLNNSHQSSQCKQQTLITCVHGTLCEWASQCRVCVCV